MIADEVVATRGMPTVHELHSTPFTTRVVEMRIGVDGWCMELVAVTWLNCGFRALITAV